MAYVWPYDDADGHGTSVEPMHACVPVVAARVPEFHNLMALIDVMRIGRTRERDAAVGLVDRALGTAT